MQECIAGAILSTDTGFDFQPEIIQRKSAFGAFIAGGRSLNPKAWDVGLQQGLRSFAEGNVAPKFLIIDDGWQQTGADAADLGTDTERLEAKKEVNSSSQTRI